VFNFPNDNDKTESVSDPADRQQRSAKNSLGRNTPIAGAFADWLIEYRNRLSKVLADEGRTTKDG
jgi:hypothetical protein